MSGRSPISVPECRRLRAAYEDGRSVGEIADEFDYARSAVRRHVHDYCSHAVDDDRWGTRVDMECPLCGDPVRHLPDHLPDCSEASRV